MTRLDVNDTPEHANGIALSFMRGLRIRTEAEIAAMELDERRTAASAILARLPDFLRLPKPDQLHSRIRNSDLKAIASWWLPERGNLLLLGPTGHGKSTAAAYAFRKVLGRGVTYGGEAWAYALRVRWFHANELERARAIHPLGKSEAPEIVQASRATLLVIDDAGWDADTAAVRTVLNERYECGVPTILTTKLTRDGLIQHYRDDGVRRLVEAGGRRVTVVEAT